MKKNKITREELCEIFRLCIKDLEEKQRTGEWAEGICVIFSDISLQQLGDRLYIRSLLPEFESICEKFEGKISKIHFWPIRPHLNSYKPRIDVLNHLIEIYSKKPTFFKKILIRLGIGI